MSAELCSRESAETYMAARPLRSSAAGVKGPRRSLPSARLKMGASEAAMNSTNVSVTAVGSCAH